MACFTNRQSSETEMGAPRRAWRRMSSQTLCKLCPIALCSIDVRAHDYVWNGYSLGECESSERDTVDGLSPRANAGELRGRATDS
jgi:hypothetical protein